MRLNAWIFVLFAFSFVMFSSSAHVSAAPGNGRGHGQGHGQGHGSGRPRPGHGRPRPGYDTGHNVAADFDDEDDDFGGTDDQDPPTFGVRKYANWIANNVDSMAGEPGITTGGTAFIFPEWSNVDRIVVTPVGRVYKVKR